MKNEIELQDINKFDNNGLTMLHRAIKNADIIKVKDLINKGADINIRAEFNYTPIQYACLFENYEAVEILLKNKVNIKNEKLLHLICASGNQKIMKLLLKNNCEVNELDEYGRTPAYWAVQENKLDCLKLLYENGADFSIKSEGNEPLLYFATGEGNIEIIKYLLEKGMKKDINNKDFPSLILASHYEYGDVVKLLIENGADVNIEDKNGKTALLNSIMDGNYEIVKILIQYTTKKKKEAINILKNQYEEIEKILAKC